MTHFPRTRQKVQKYAHVHVDVIPAPNNSAKLLVWRPSNPRYPSNYPSH